MRLFIYFGRNTTSLSVEWIQYAAANEFGTTVVQYLKTNEWRKESRRLQRKSLEIHAHDGILDSGSSSSSITILEPFVKQELLLLWQNLKMAQMVVDTYEI